MALSLKIQNQILAGAIRPADITLFELIVLMSQKHAQYFLNTVKNVPESNTEAISYKNKCLATAKRIINNDSGVFQTIHRNLITHVANLTNEADLIYTTTFWEWLVESNLPTVFELVSDVTNSERTAYVNIPN